MRSAVAFENAQPVRPVLYLWTELMHLPRYESLGERLRKTPLLRNVYTTITIHYLIALSVIIKSYFKVCCK